jgi:hypothetical protein
MRGKTLKTIDGLRPGQFLIRVLFSVAVTAAVGLGAYFLMKFLVEMLD